MTNEKDGNFSCSVVQKNALLFVGANKLNEFSYEGALEFALSSLESATRLYDPNLPLDINITVDRVKKGYQGTFEELKALAKTRLTE